MSCFLRQPVRCLCATGAILLVVSGLCRADGVTVTVKQRAPMESLSPAGDISGVSESTVGNRYTLVSCAGDQVTLKDSAGEYRIAMNATDYVPPAPASATAPSAAASPTMASTNVVTQATPEPKTSASAPTAAATATTPTATPTANSSAAASTASLNPDAPTAAPPVSQDKIDSVDAGLGKPIFSSTSFWQEPALLIAQRLGLGLEGHTKWETSYRRYFSGDPADPKAALLGTGVYCIALYADADDHPTSLLMAFDNDGDYKEVVRITSDIYRLQHPLADAHLFFPGKSLDDLQKQYNDIVASFEPARQAEADLLVKNLSTLFGDPRKVAFGSDVATREDSQRWDFGDVSFLLTSQENKYNLLRMVPTALADNNGRAERIPRDEIGEKLSSAVEHRPNGDVVITQIPMADQGPKGYCVPATWERVLRYTGVPGDMYTLSRIGNSGFGGGTYGGNLIQQLDDTLHNYGRHTEFLNIDILDDVSIRHYIDDGVPIFWSVNPLGYEATMQRYALVDRSKDWDQWKALLVQVRAASTSKQPPLGSDGGHQVLITGYNSDSKEIAWTDPWGRFTTERWMTVEEAQRCSLGQFYIITW